MIFQVKPIRASPFLFSFAEQCSYWVVLSRKVSFELRERCRTGAAKAPADAVREKLSSPPNSSSAQVLLNRRFVSSNYDKT